MGKIVLKTQNRVVAGQERITTSKVNYSTIGSDLICARVAQTSNIKVTTVKSALLGIKEAVRYFVCNGHSVNLGPMGILSLSIQADSVAQAHQVRYANVSKLSLVYRPSTQIKGHLAEISFS